MKGKMCVVTGGGGVLCSVLARQLAERGASVVVLDLDADKAEQVATGIRSRGGNAMAVRASVLDRDSLNGAAGLIEKEFGRVDVLINGAGGNRPGATTGKDRSFFDLEDESIRSVFDLNFLGSLLPSQVLGRMMVKQGEGVILNIASMNALRPLTRIPAYSAAKAAIANFTQWLAVHMAQEYSPRIRVNAIAPGFFLTEQNRFLLQQEDGSLTKRGQQILDHTPMARFGEPEDLVGVVEWLVSPRADFVTGVVVPIDGGFSAFSGV